MGKNIKYILGGLFAIWFIGGFIATTFSPTLNNARGWFLGSVFGLGVLVGHGIEIFKKKTFAYWKRGWKHSEKKVFQFDSEQASEVGTILIVIGMCLFIICSFQWIRLLISVRDWSLQISLGALLFWIFFFFIFLLFVIWQK